MGHVGNFSPPKNHKFLIDLFGRYLQNDPDATLVLVGDGDLATPPELNKEIADGIAGARLVIVPDCGHLSTIERPDAVNAALAEWLER